MKLHGEICDTTEHRTETPSYVGQMIKGLLKHGDAVMCEPLRWTSVVLLLKGKDIIFVFFPFFLTIKIFSMNHHTKGLVFLTLFILDAMTGVRENF